jgi:ketosteroid isomerase-like protein
MPPAGPITGGADMTSASPGTADQAAALEANKVTARKFIEIFNARDYTALEALFAPDFRWHVAIIGEQETERRPFQSKELQAKQVMLPGPLLDKEESLKWFKNMFTNGEDERTRFHLRLVSLTAEQDRVAMEAEGDLGNPANGRRYQNIYFILLRIRDGQITLYKEYQDTLHIYDVFYAE